MCSKTDLDIGLTFSPDGEYAYITDTGIDSGFFGLNFTRPASVYVSHDIYSIVSKLMVCFFFYYSYRYDVKEDGTFENRKVFAFVTSGAPDGKFNQPRSRHRYQDGLELTFDNSGRYPLRLVGQRVCWLRRWCPSLESIW